MARITIWLGALLILIGVGAYFGAGRVSVTALIPAFFGVPFLLLGILALKEKYRMHAMHAAAVLGLLAFAGSVGGLVALIQAAFGAELVKPTAVVVQSIMAVLMIIFLILAVKSFIDARRARKEVNPPPATE